MPDILSQAEIDELLNALQSGEDPVAAKQDEAAAAGEAKLYDFRTANRFPKEQMRTFQAVFDNFAQLLTSKLTNILHATCECSIVSVEETTFLEFNNAMSGPVILAIISAPPMAGNQLVQISPEVAYMLITRLFGGTEAGMSNSKQFTEIEIALVERFLHQIIGEYDEAWEKILNVSTYLDRLETSMQFAQITAITEPVAVVAINVTIGDESGIMSVCMPHASIEPVAKQIKTRFFYSGSSDGSKDRDENGQISNKLQTTRVSLLTYFDDTPARVEDILNLQIGDVISLAHKVSEPLTINVEHIPKFRAMMGSSSSKCALKIVNIIDSENRKT
ncbi:MAG: flagellar motor switch protein FliM [Oscillospiraceae bacterium]|nr:flagellar motor switch protein FliM [Oscillospiraceae bacterium]